VENLLQRLLERLLEVFLLVLLLEVFLLQLVQMQNLHLHEVLCSLIRMEFQIL
jgi:hypothetical protein